jgi:hypothetical protein
VKNICPRCGRDYGTKSCFPSNTAPVYGDEPHWAETDAVPLERCWDCGVRLGGHHHVLCDQARCQHGQRLSCEQGCNSVVAVLP